MTRTETNRFKKVNEWVIERINVFENDFLTEVRIIAKRRKEIDRTMWDELGIEEIL